MATSPPWGDYLPSARKPYDWLKGGTKVGAKYSAYSNYGQGAPNLGKGKGPGDPYHVVTKKVKKGSMVPSWAKDAMAPTNGVAPKWEPTGDARTDAIRRRLRGL